MATCLVRVCVCVCVRNDRVLQPHATEMNGHLSRACVRVCVRVCVCVSMCKYMCF